MQTSTMEKVSATFLQIVEQLTFMFGEPTPKEELGVESHSFILARMSFTGDLVGTLAVAVPAEITAEIAANILGLEPEDIESDEMRMDALGEMLNVVCGHVIMGLVGTDANFVLNSPEELHVDEDLLAAMMLSDDFMGFMLDDNPTLFGLSLEN